MDVVMGKDGRLDRDLSGLTEMGLPDMAPHQSLRLLFDKMDPRVLVTKCKLYKLRVRTKQALQ
ncbi:hypothetical protein F6B41_34025 [Microbacterium lushaniae]|nr:hypothetical protein F6B41_34025 [Microbacterium lushaniae]